MTATTKASPYRALPASLHSTADAAKGYFKKNLGLFTFKVEQPIHPDVAGRPTLSLEHGGVFYCVEVSDTAFPKTLDQFVLDCKNLVLPVKVYVAMPKDWVDPMYQTNISRARLSGIGVLMVDSHGGGLVLEPLALSLTGVRSIPKENFQAKHRQAIAHAEETFRGGSPEKGCSLLYDLLELWTREAAKRALKKGAWTKVMASGHSPTIDLDKGNWKPVLETVIKNCDFAKIGCVKLDNDLLHRVLAVVPHRNDTGHEPKKLADRIKRDKQLRTRFENAADILEDVADAIKTLRI